MAPIHIRIYAACMCLRPLLVGINESAVVYRLSLKSQHINAGHAGGSHPPLVFLSSFDASCLEFRMLLPQLEAAGAEAYAVDLVGWGLTEADVEPRSKQVIGAAERRQHLLEFCKQKVRNSVPVVKRPFNNSISSPA